MEFPNEKFDITLTVAKDAKKTLTRVLELYCVSHGWDLNNFRAQDEPCEVMFRELGETLCIQFTYPEFVQDALDEGWVRLPKTVRNSLPAVASRIARRFTRMLRADNLVIPCTEKYVRVKQLECDDVEYDIIEEPMDCNLIIKPWSMDSEHNT